MSTFARALLPLTLLVGPASAQAVDTFFNRNVPTECAQQLRAYTAAGAKILCVAYPPGGGNRFSIVTDLGFFNRNIPQECHDKMVEYWNAGHKILCVAFPPAGGNRWSLVTDRGFFNRGIPQECHDRMRTFWSGGHRPIWVAFPPAGGNRWSVVTHTGQFFNRGIPQECHDRMNTFWQAGQRTTCVAFPPAGGNRWTVVTEGSFFNRGVPSETHRVMRAMFRVPGGPLRCVAYDMDGNGFTVVSAASPAGLPATLEKNGEVFSIDKFADNLETALAGQVKYGFVVRLGNSIRSRAGGPKRTANTAPAQDFTIYDRFNPASVTKTITGVAVCDALDAANVSIDDSIAPYLPSFWTVPRSVATITFKQLLQHRSGFRTGGYYYADLQQMVEAGIDLNDKVYKYSNLNYALARILVAYLDGYSEAGVSDHGAATSNHFISYVQSHIFDPCGAPSVKFTPDAIEPTLFFPNPPGSSNGTTYGDWALRPGSAGIHTSIAELAIFLDRLRNSTSILSANMRTQMDDHNLGWDKRANAYNGFRHDKGGYFPGSWNGGAELHSTIMKFDTGVQVAAVINGELGIGSAVLDAYEQAWMPKPVLILTATSTILNLTTSSVEITGANLDLVRTAYFGRHVITSTDASDPTQPYIQHVSPRQLRFHTPQGLLPAVYDLRLASSKYTSRSVEVQVLPTRTPTLLTSPYVVAGDDLPVLVSTGGQKSSQAYLAYSLVASPSVFPGIVSLGIGNGFKNLYIWPVPAPIDPATGVGRFDVPSLPSMRRLSLWYQGLLFTPQLPLPETDIGSAVYR